MPGLRLDRGLNLIINPDDVALIHEAPGLLEFLVKGSGPKEFYEVYCLDDNWLCMCKDFMNRHQRQDKTFVCKHIAASIFKYYLINASKLNTATNTATAKATIGGNG
jgi:hypothetical protein